MKERPILFSGPMVRAILNGRKTVTRRLVPAHHPFLGGPSEWCAAARAREPGWMHIVGDYGRFCPYGNAGDRLWVRETFARNYFDDQRTGYRADWSGRAANVCPEPRWTPSIFMRRHESRINLEVVSVRVERLHDITEADARAEGVTRPTTVDLCPCRGTDEDPGPHRPTCLWRDDSIDPIDGAPHVTEFAILWNSINGKRAAWDSNPWVWRVEFRRIDAATNGGGSCPFCASRISVTERDGIFVARCSHRGCGARGPKHRDISRACDLFCCPPKRTACGMSALAAGKDGG